MAFKLGLEKIGLVCLKRPRLSALILLAVTTLAIFGASRISVDDSLSELFRSDTAEFRQYARLDQRFPSSEYDVLVVVEGKTLLTPQGLTAFRNFILELQFVPATKGLISMFSAREPPDASGYPQPLFPEEIPEGEDFARLLERVKENGIIKGRLMSDDGELSLVVIALDKEQIESAGLKDVIGQISQTGREQLAGTGLTASLSGVPVYQLEIRNAVQQDRLLYNGLGFLLGAAICVIFLRRAAFTIIAVAGPVMAVIWALGLLGFLNIKLNLFLNIITPLIMVISFADSMHMVFAIRRRLMAGDDAYAAAKRAVERVGPASMLTMFTNMAAFISLIFSDSALIRTFGIAGILSTVIVFFAVITLAPTLAVLMLKGEKLSGSTFRENDSGMNWLNGASAWLSRHLKAYATAYTLLSIGLAVAFGSAYMQLKPQYKLADQVPDREQAIQASGKLDQKLTGANPIHVLVEWRDGKPVYDQRRLEAIREVHDIVEQTAGLGNVWSMHTLRRWLAQGGETRPEVLEQYVKLLPDYLTRRFLTAEGDAIVVTGRVPDADAGEILPVVSKLDDELAPLREAYPELTISVTGLPAIAARNSAEMIGQLNRGLFADIFMAMIIITIAFRSLWAGVFSLVPNLLPILAAGAMLHWSGIGLQFASIVALTVAFGLAIDNVVHYLYRLQLEDEATDDGVLAAERTIGTIGPIVILTTAVLIAGLAMPVFSALPSLRLFGILSATVLVVALISVLIFLPAIIFFVRKIMASRPAKPAEGQPTPAE